jgi:hypothetical protein
VDLDRAGPEKSLSDLPDASGKIRFIVFHHIEHYTTHASAAKTLLHESSAKTRGWIHEVEC